MKVPALFLSCCVALGGCATQQTIHQVGTQAVATSITSLNKSSLKLDTQAMVTIDDNTQVLSNSVIDSPVVALDVPANRGPLDISVTSNMVDKAFFSPEMLLVSEEGEVIERYDASIFEYQRPRLAWGDRLVAEVRFTPPVNQQSVTLLIYTTAAELAKTTDRVDPYRAMVEGQGGHMPELKDIPTAHVTSGKLVVEVSGVSAVSASVEPSDAQNPSLHSSVEQSTQDYYHKAIRQAVQDNNIPKALALVDEGKGLNVPGVQQVYIEAIQAQQ
ncbi:MalM family protein [Vibrio rarus]|uniref:MalM family protein n=1 Tax=Vibrio rarus TaxID=413403 RepID=UPI0021C3995D|nr:MalM family protein [Vibrio rarus]